MKHVILFLLCLSLVTSVNAENNVLNIYAWTGEISPDVLRQFENETGIKVNFAEYENNEIMYAKLRATPHAGYDLIMPSGYLVDRMIKQKMLEPLDTTVLSNWHNIEPHFLNPAYDPGSKYSVPFLITITGIFVNDAYHQPASIAKWSDLWNSKYKNSLLILDDIREVFSAALIALGYSVNDENPAHIQQAFLKLKQLKNNIKVFSTDAIDSIMIDEDATLGMTWNGDAFKASQENQHIKFIYPRDGFIVSTDCFAIPQNAPHRQAAYRFINFMLRPEVAKMIALYTGYPITNRAGKKLLPATIRDNKTIYPPLHVLKQGHHLLDLKNETLAIYEKYWEELKMSL